MNVRGKRRKGEGALFYSKAKNVWVGRAIVGVVPEGMPKYREVTGRTEEECLAKKRKLEKDAGYDPPPPVIVVPPPVPPPPQPQPPSPIKEQPVGDKPLIRTRGPESKKTARYRTPEEIAALFDLTVERVKNLCETGYAPHHYLDGRGPLLNVSEFHIWFKNNLKTSHGGMPMPKSLHVPLFPSGTGTTTDERPSSLAMIDNLKKLAICGSESGVYFLVLRGKVVYVGASRSVFARIGMHIRAGEKEFDSVFYLPVPITDLEKVEQGFAEAIRPKYNIGSDGKLRW